MTEPENNQISNQLADSPEQSNNLNEQVELLSAENTRLTNQITELEKFSQKSFLLKEQIRKLQLENCQFSQENYELREIINAQVELPDFEALTKMDLTTQQTKCRELVADYQLKKQIVAKGSFLIKKRDQQIKDLKNKYSDLLEWVGQNQQVESSLKMLAEQLNSSQLNPSLKQRVEELIVAARDKLKLEIINLHLFVERGSLRTNLEASKGELQVVTNHKDREIVDLTNALKSEVAENQTKDQTIDNLTGKNYILTWENHALKEQKKIANLLGQNIPSPLYESIIGCLALLVFFILYQIKRFLFAKNKAEIAPLTDENE